MPTIKLSTNVAAQVLGMALQGANQLTPFLDGNQKFWLSVVVGFFQLVAAVLAHYSTTAGQSVKTLEKK